MATVADYLAKLSALRVQIAQSLSYMGVSATETETLQQLVPKLLTIQIGDTSKEVFIAALKSIPVGCTYGFYGYTETALFAGVATITAMCRMSSAELRISGTGLTNLTITAPGWVQTSDASGILLSIKLSATDTRYHFQKALDAITLRSTAAARLRLSLSTIGLGGGRLPANGTTDIVFSGTTWAALDAFHMTWADAEQGGRTWDGMENMGKPKV